MTNEQRASSSAHAPRYASLEDYLHALRRRRLIIGAFALVGVVFGLALAVSRTETYTSTANLSFRDISQDLRAIGIDALPENPPQILAAVNAELIARPEVTRRVAREFDGELTPGELAGSVNARVATRTGLVAVEATSEDRELSPRIANGYAEQVRAIGSKQIKRRLQRVIESYTKQIERLSSGQGENLEFGIATRVALLEGQVSQLRTLKDIAQPVQIVDRALAGRPNSLGTPASGVIGGLIGLVLGLIAGFSRDALDKRVRNAHEVHRELDLPVLGRIPESALGYPGLLQRNGAEPMWDSDFEAFRALRTNLGYLEQQNGQGPVRCLLVTSAMPDEGKSTVSMSLASAAAAAGQRVLLIEADLRRPCFAKRLGTPPGPGLCDYLRRDDLNPQQILRTIELSAPRASAMTRPDAAADPEPVRSARLACILAGGAAADSAELLLSARLKEMIEVVRRAYDLVVIDSSPMLAVADPLELVQYVDAVLVCVRAHASTRDEIRSLRAVLSTLPERPASAIVTGLRRGGPDSYKYYYGY